MCHVNYIDSLITRLDSPSWVIYNVSDELSVPESLNWKPSQVSRGGKGVIAPNLFLKTSCMFLHDFQDFSFFLFFFPDSAPTEIFLKLPLTSKVLEFGIGIK